MCETCKPNSSGPTPLRVEQIRDYFPDALEVFTGARYNDSRRRRRVIVFDRSSLRMVRIVGECPNIQNGSCKLGDGCFARLVYGKKV